MTTPIILGIAAPKGSGKSTLAAMLMRRLCGKVAVLSFAGPLKEAACALMPSASAAIYGDQQAKAAPLPSPWCDALPPAQGTARGFLQWLGTDVLRRICPEFLLRGAEDHIRSVQCDSRISEPPLAIVFDDVRFDTEADWVRARGRVVHLVRLGHHPVDAHVSEAGVTRRPCDTVIEAATIDDLRIAADHLADLVSGHAAREASHA